MLGLQRTPVVILALTWGEVSLGGRMRIYLGIALIASCAVASAQFSDNFNRADGGLGANYDLVAGPATNVIGNMAGGTSGANGLTLVKSSVFTGAYNLTTVKADLSLSDQSSALTYCALALGNDGSSLASHGLFIKLQRQVAGGFSHIGAYTGSGTNTTDISLNGGNFQALTSQINRCRMTVMCPTTTSLYIGLDTDFNNVDDVTYTGTLNTGTLITGNRVGLHIFGTTGRIDNYDARTVPEPASMAALGLGVAALIRKRRK